MQSESILEIQNLKKYFKVKKAMLHAVDDVSLSIAQGSTLGVVGESGCGKSTLGRTVLRLTEPTSGEVLFKGQSILNAGRGEMKTLRRKMSMIFQDPYASLNPRMSVHDLIADPMRANKVYRSRADMNHRVEQLMDTVGLAKRVAYSYPHELDGGRRQRIGVAKALALDPEFIVCDEPVSALDVSIQAQILNLLMDLRDERGLTYMFITHDLSVVRHISDEIIVMYMGKCVERATAKTMFENPMHPYTKALLKAIPVPSYEHIGKEPGILSGEVSNPINPKPGCRFSPRCSLRQEACTAEDIPLKEVEPGHFVACLECGASSR